MSFQIIQNDWSVPGSMETSGISAARPWQSHRVCILSVEFNTCFFHVRLFIGEQLCLCRWEANWCVHPLEELRLQPQLGTTEFYSRKEAFEVILPGVCLNTRSPSAVTCPWLLASWRQLFSWRVMEVSFFSLKNSDMVTVYCRYFRVYTCVLERRSQYTVGYSRYLCMCACILGRLLKKTELWINFWYIFKIVAKSLRNFPGSCPPTALWGVLALALFVLRKAP